MMPYDIYMHFFFVFSHPLIFLGQLDPSKPGTGVQLGDAAVRPVGKGIDGQACNC
jgi:hypothetical protein